MTKELSVIIPAYNEEELLTGTVDSVVAYLREKEYRFEVILVNDGSTDRTKEKILESLGRHREATLINFESNRGKGQAIKAGIAQARYATCLFMDADNATSIREWDKFEPLFKQGAKAVVASRRLAASRIVHPQPGLRRFLGGGYRLLCRGLFGLSLRDFNCGFKAYETSLAKKIYAQVRMTDWTFDLEVLCLLRREGITPQEVPVQWEHKEKKSHLKPLQAAAASLASLVRLKKNLASRG